MEWNIPPVGWCFWCLVEDQDERPAATLRNGTSLCREHARQEYDSIMDLG